MSVSSNFPNIQPSLNLSFALTKRLDPRVTFTRTTTATYYDGVTTAMAEQNLLLQSQDFSTTWLAARVTVSANTGDTTAPDGTNTADKITNDNVNDSHIVYQPLTLNGKAFTFSVFAKKGTADFVLLRASDGTTTRMVWFNLNTGAVATTETNITASIVNVGNGWYRCIGTWSASTSSSANYSIGIAEADNSFNYVGTNKDIYLWGAQLEQRSSVTSYTATTTQAITNYIPVLLTAASGVARFQHNPTTDESLGLLIEEQRTNLLTYSADLSNAAWTKVRSSITSNTIVAPDGTLTGDKLVEDTTASNTHFVNQSASVTNPTQYTVSVYLKAGERTIVDFITASGTATYSAISVNLTLGTIGPPITGLPSAVSTSTITSVGNGWYRITMNFVGDSGGFSGCQVRLTNGTTDSYTGDGYSGIFIWGAQLEAGAFATSYIATTSATVTRNADAASMTGSNFTSWYNQGEGAVYTELSSLSPLTSVQSYALNKYPSVFNFESGTTDTYVSWYGITAEFYIGNTFNNLGSVPTGANKLAVSFSTTSGQGASSLNGAAAASRSGALTGTATRLGIGSNLDFLSGSCLNGTIKKLAYYPLRLTNANLQALTS